MFLYALTILVSAFLLFQIEPVIAKMILPWFGGSAAVWTVCLLFFQLVLLAGYLYAHAIHRYLRSAVQTRLHLVLLAVSLMALPVIPKASWKPTGTEDPTWAILLLLSVTVGLPYLLLSTTGPLVQAWFSRRYPGGATYRLYALSNAGSMFALLSYPILFEPALATRTQGVSWSWAYGLFVVLCGVTAWVSRGYVEKPVFEANPADAPPTAYVQALWVGLPACASVLLLAVTNYLSQDVAAIPFLWVLPLSLYLLTFIICFDREKWYNRNLFLRFTVVALGGMAYSLTKEPQVRVAIPLFSAGLFLCCMVCHGELVRLKPAPRYLTKFYLMISVGGAVGGVFVGLLAPHLFHGVFELHIALGACGIIVLAVLYARTRLWWLAVIGGLAFTGCLAAQVWKSGSEYRLMVRNFYGSIKVEDPDDPKDPDAVRKLVHGIINHGQQFLDPQKRDWPTTYYGPNTGVGLAIREAQPRGPERIGVIGLGTGTIAAYGRPGDYIRYYDINPLVIRLANTEFTFLKDCKAKLDVALGDARLSLEREPSQQFDVLAVDAFSGDAIPVHLLTREAFDVYFRHLKPGGVLAVHVSNKYLDLEPVVHGLAAYLHKEDGTVDTEDDDSTGVFGATWVLVCGRHDFFGNPLVHGAAIKVKEKPGLRLWTDDYSNLFQIIKK
jgi:SAM-dependent methyltransferase